MLKTVQTVGQLCALRRSACGIDGVVDANPHVRERRRESSF
jgi:hypothetical protein